MSFINDCCRQHMSEIAPDYTGDEFDCSCRNHFIYDGERWQNVLSIGSAKTEKYRKIKRASVNLASLEEARGTLLF